MITEQAFAKLNLGLAVIARRGDGFHELDTLFSLIGLHDDVSGEPLVQRDDDKEETIRKRLEIYHTQTQPLVEFYRQLSETQGTPKCSRVEGVGTVDEITAKVLDALS